MKITTRSTIIGIAVAASLAIVPAGALASPPEGAGCQGLYEHARFATFQNGDTPGHDRVHEVFEMHGCEHHHHD